ncbi:MAG TPA: hypothetical protein VMS64_21395 [Candidatus Methylomirabilis sp.]|nr:hypothetical protein [Candidatus Methylomirabilis sp.]
MNGEETLAAPSEPKRAVDVPFPVPLDPRRCPTCRTKIVVPDEDGLVIKNAILRVIWHTGHVKAKCPRCKTWVEVPLRYRE